MTGIPCPCCGRPMEAPRAPLDDLVSIPMEGKQRGVLEVLQEIYPRAASKEFLIERLYDYSGDGPPDTVEQIIKVYVSRLRKVLVPYGWTIPSCRNGRGSHDRYRLAPIEARTEANGIPGPQTPANPTTRVSDHRNRQERA